MQPQSKSHQAFGGRNCKLVLKRTRKGKGYKLNKKSLEKKNKAREHIVGDFRVSYKATVTSGHLWD